MPKFAETPCRFSKLIDDNFKIVQIITEDKKMRKQLEIILTALFPVMVLAVGFFVVSSKAELRNNETAIPEEAGPFYRYPGVDGEYFGAEIYFNVMCDVFNGFEIVSAFENATVSASDIAGAVSWDKVQNWRFNGDTPWGGHFAIISADITIRWSEIRTGFPWSGHQGSVRVIDDGEQVIYDSGTVIGWEQFTDPNEAKHICPMSYFHTLDNKLFCVDKSFELGEMIIIGEEGFGDPVLVDPEEGIYSRKVVDIGRWIDCKKLN